MVIEKGEILERVASLPIIPAGTLPDIDDYWGGSDRYIDFMVTRTSAEGDLGYFTVDLSVISYFADKSSQFRHLFEIAFGTKPELKQFRTTIQPGIDFARWHLPMGVTLNS